MTFLLAILVVIASLEAAVIVWQRRRVKKLTKTCYALAWDVAQLRWMFPDGEREPGKGIH